MMAWIHEGVNLILHLNQHLNTMVQLYGMWVYAAMFLIIFCETGLVLTPFLPGDTLLFAVGAIAAAPNSHMNLVLAWGLMSVAAVLGNVVNYQVGRIVGPRVFTDRFVLLKKEHLDRTRRYFDKFGGKTIVLARFVPVVRTIAPFVAGIGAMAYARFMFYNVIGSLAWTVVVVCAGFFFGRVPVIAHNFALVVLGIAVVSMLPMLIDLFHSWRRGGPCEPAGEEPRKIPASLQDPRE